MRIITFNGLGEPTDNVTQDGDIAILVQDGEVKVVKIELLPPKEYGPSLFHAVNQNELRDQAYILIESNMPNVLNTEIDTLVSCPSELSKLAEFK